MEMDSVNPTASINQVVEEFPAPPEYYKNVVLTQNLIPPAIPEGDPYSAAYSGIFASVTQSRATHDTSKDYKELLKK